MEINYVAVIVCAALSMIIGFVWYGLLFGRIWTRIIGATESDLEARRQMQKKAGPLYGVQFLLTLIQVYILAQVINTWTDASGTLVALWIYLGFIVPTVAAGSMWNNDSRKIAWSRFGIQAGYYLVLFLVFGLVLGFWQ